MANLFDLVAKLTLDSSEYEKGLDSAVGKITSIGGTIAKVGTAAVGAAAAGIVAFGKSAVDAGMNFDSSMSQVAATMGTTVDQIGELRDFAQDMGSTTAFSATQAADALNYMALAGYDAETSMQMLPNVLNLAAAGGIELASASDMVTDAQSALGLSLDQTSELVDKMAKASSKSNTSVAQLGDAILTVGGTAKNLAGGTTELSTALGILADNGIKGAEGGTALRNIILSLSSPTDTAAKKMKELGLSAYDAEGNLRPMQDIFSDLNSTLSTMTQGEQTEVLSTLFNKVDLKSANALLATSADRWDELSGAIDDASGAAQQMADTQLDNLAGDITLFKSALEGAQIAVSDMLSPALREFVQIGTDGISDVTKAFQEGGFEAAADSAGQVIGELVTKVATYAPKVISAAISLIQSLGSALIENAPQLIDSALAIVTELVNGLSEMAPAILPAAANLITELAMALTNPDTLSGILEGALGIITGLAEGLMSAVGTLAEAAPVIINNLVTFIVANLPMIIQTGLTLIQTLVDGIIQNLAPLLTGAIQIITALVNGITQMLPELIPLAGEIVITLVSAIIKNLPELLSAGIQVLAALIEGIVSRIGTLLETGMDLVAKLFEVIVDSAKQLIDAGKELVQKVKDGFMAKVEEAKQWGKDLINNFIDGLKQKWENLKSTVSNIAATVKSFLGFSEPEEGPLSNFHTYAPDMMELFMKGIRDNEGDLKAQVAHTFDFGDAITQPEAMTYTAPVTSTETDKTDAVLAAIEDLKNAILNHTIELDGDVVANAVNRRLGDSYYGARRSNA